MRFIAAVAVAAFLLAGQQAAGQILPSQSGGQEEQTAPASSAPSLSFTGRWNIKLKGCGGWGYTGSLDITRADAGVVLGIRVNNSGTGDIVGGRFVGRDVQFSSSFKFNGRILHSAYVGTLSADGQTAAGTHTSDYHSKTCTWSASRP